MDKGELPVFTSCLDRGYTDIVKYLCCVLIFLFHFYIKYFDNLQVIGYSACTVFFFFSAYGIVKSQCKRNLGFGDFVFCVSPSHEIVYITNR